MILHKHHVNAQKINIFKFMKTQIDTFIDKLRDLLLSKQDKKSVKVKLEKPDELAEQIAREIGSDTQRIKFHEY